MNIVQVAIRVGLGVLVSVAIWWLTLGQNIIDLPNSFRMVGAAIIFWTFLTNIGETVTTGGSDTNRLIQPHHEVRSKKMQRMKRTFQYVNPLVNILAGIILIVIAQLIL